MKKFKRTIAMMLSFLLLITSIPAASLTAFAAAADDSNIVLGSNGKITRAEWLHNLVYVFEMVVEEEALPDNYYSDLDESHKYYEDILLAVEFGVVDVEAGGTLRPDDAVTREFAASTLNFCLGYQLDEGTEYTFADYADCLAPDSAQVAVDRKWFALINGNFSPATLVTESEVEFMFDDALEILGKTVVDATYTSTFEFEDDIIVIPDGTEVSEDENGTVHITNCSQTINSGDRFAVYYNGIPSVYTADTVSTENSVTSITVTTVESDDAFVSVDAQGVTDAEAMEITPVEGVDVSFEEDNSGITTFSTKKLKSIKAKTELELFPGVTADVSVKIKSPEIEYSVNSSYAYVLLQGDTEISYSIEANLVEMAFGDKAIELFTVSVLGIGNFTVSVEFELSGAASGEVEGYLVAGLECTKGDKIRAVKSFQQKQYSSNVEATASVGLKVTLGITKMPIISAYVYAEAGVKANLKATTYSDDKEPSKCVHFAAYLYVKYGATASAKFGGWKTSLSVNYDVYNESNSPVKIVHHYENGVLVPSCTRGTDYSNFFTKASSRWGGSGWISANGAYGLNADGTYFALYDYTLNENNEATITQYNGNSWSVYIPKEIDGYTVVAIGSKAFQYKDLSRIVIPDTVTSIGTYAFNGCYYLRSVSIPDSVTVIDMAAFANCTSLTDVALPSNLSELDRLAFGYCTALSSVNIPKNLEYVSGSSSSTSMGPFAYCSNLKNVEFDAGITTIQNNLFEYCYGLENITLPDTVTTIKNHAFYNCENLKSVAIPDSVTEIDNCAFMNCYQLSAVSLPKSLVVLGGYAFGYCSSLDKINIPKSIESVWGSSNSMRKGPFAYCSSLKEIQFETGITEIQNNLFEYCNGLESIDIPDTVTTIESYAFYNCPNLSTVNIPISVTTIDSGAFMYCAKLTNVSLPAQLSSLGGYAFAYCDALSKINIPKSIETVWGSSNSSRNGPFYYCSVLKEVDFEEGITAIQSNLFEGCTGLEEIIIPNTVTVIKTNAFYNCENLKKVVFSNNLVQIGNSAFYSCENLNGVALPDSLTQIDKNAFAYCTTLTDISIPSNVITLGDYCFRDCTALTEVELPSTMKTIVAGMFYNCTSIESISLPNNLTVIENSAFYGCSSLKEVLIPQIVKEIEYSAFQNCTGLVKTSIPQSVKTIGGSAFMGCEALSDITIADYSITEIQYNTFKDCPALVSVVLPKGLTTIGSQAFMNDTALVNVTIPESVTSIDSTAFSYPTKTTIYGRTGSYAETFANDGGFTFVDNSVPVEGIILKDGVENVTLDVGETYRAEFEVYPEDANDVITLTADNTNVTINGHDIYARYAGDTVITATSTSGLTYEFNIHIRSIKGIEVITNPTKTTYIMGEEFDKTGMVVQVNYYDGSSKIVDDYTISGFDSSAEGTNTVTVKWMSSTSQILTTYSTTFTVTIVDPTPKLTGIYIDTLPTKLNYELREKLDTTGLVVKGTYTDNSTKEITDYTVSGYNALKSGSQTITVTYGDFTATFTVSVGAVKTLSAVSVAQAPTKTEYYIGDTLSTAGLQLTLTYSDNSTTIVSSGFTTSGFDSASAGTKTITVSYEGVSTTFTVTVKTPSIVISETEKALLVDEIVTLTATTDSTGQTITWTSSNNSVATVSNGVVTAKSEGSAVITAQFTYNGINYEKTCTISVTEPEVTLTAINIVSEPSKTVYYIGDDLVTDGLQIKLTYSDSTTDTITTGYSVSGFSSATAGTKTVTVSYGGFTDTFTVTVKTPGITLSSNAETLTVGENVILSATTLPGSQSVVWDSSSDSVATVNNGTVVAEGAGTAVITAKFTYNGVVYSATCSITVESAPVTLTSVTVNTQPLKTVYEIGESLDTTGLVLKLTYSDGSTETVTSGFTTSGFSSETAGTKTVTVDYKGLSTTFTVTINEVVVNENAPIVTVESKTAKVGSTVLLTVNLQNNPGIWGMDLVVNYDKTQLTLTSVTNGTVFSSSEWTQGNLSGDKYILSYEASGFDDITANGVLATLEFTVSENATVDSFSSVTLSYKVGDIINVSFEDINVAVVSGGVEIINFIYGDLNGDTLVNKKDSLLMKMYLADNSTSIDMQAADVYVDGSINKKDSLYLKQYLAGLDVELGA